MKRYFSLIILIIFIVADPIFQIYAQSGRISYTLYRESNPTQDQSDAYKKITSAMDSAIGYYNRHTSLTKNLNVYYNTNVETADATFKGTIRFGSSRSYMAVHTAMHEIAHTIGIGTTTEYQSLIKNNVFTGTHATAKLREINGDQSAVLKGDNQHFWPYGLNYASEVSGVKDLINHCLIVNEIFKDLFKESFYGAFHLKSKSSGKIVYVQQNDLLLGSRLDSSSVVNLVTLSDTNTYRLEFGDKVLDIPNESKDAGVQVKLWNWNGGTHQRAYFEFQSQNVARIRMAHSGLYLRADGDRILQDKAATSIENQYWELVPLNDPPVKIIDKQAKSHHTNPSLIITNNNISLLSSETRFYPAILTILDLQGRVRHTKQVDRNNPFSLSDISPGTYIARIQIGNQHVTTSEIFIK